MHGESEELKSLKATFLPSPLPLCLTWGAPVKHGESVGMPQNLAMKGMASAPGDSPALSVWAMTAPLATQERWGLGSLLLFLLALLLLKGGHFTSTQNTESLLGMCQAKQKHMVWIYSPKIEQERGGK